MTLDISIFGLGYVGAVSAGCLASDGNHVIGVDPNPAKVEMINAGRSPIVEDRMEEIIAAGVASKALRATTSADDAVKVSDISLICVGTPSQNNGSLDLRYVKRVCEEIGEALREKRSYHVVVARSTMLPGSMRELVIPTLQEASGLTAGVDFGVCINPEFLRESTAVSDYYHPPKTVIGEIDEKSGQLLADLYNDLEAPLIRTSLEVAEMVKYADNSWHALKVAFANEIGSMCRAMGIDGPALMQIFCQDKKLNLSPYYLTPGLSFGGSCLPKDVRALTYKARGLDIDVPVLSSILPSNRTHLQRAIDLITVKESRKVGVLGFAFKSGTDDLRESPMVDIIEFLLGKGYDLRVYDSNVNLSALMGANRDHFMNRIPHIAQLMVDNVSDVIDFADTIVIGNRAPEFEPALANVGDNQQIIDLVRMLSKTTGGNYDGICW